MHDAYYTESKLSPPSGHSRIHWWLTGLARTLWPPPSCPAKEGPLPAGPGHTVACSRCPCLSSTAELNTSQSKLVTVQRYCSHNTWTLGWALSAQLSQCDTAEQQVTLVASCHMEVA